jgi:hypothetical protein
MEPLSQMKEAQLPKLGSAMADLFYTLESVNSAIADNGNRVEFTLRFHHASPIRFYMSYESTSVFAAQINTICQQMTKQLTESGGYTKGEMSSGAFEFDPFHFFSARMRMSDDNSAIVLALQTTEGPLLHISITTPDAHKLAEQILRGHIDNAAADKKPFLN